MRFIHEKTIFMSFENPRLLDARGTYWKVWNKPDFVKQNIFQEKKHAFFQWTRSPDLPCENNYAERALRPLVITRKISYGSQFERGMKTREILASVLHTAVARGLELATFLEAFLNNSKNASILFS